MERSSDSLSKPSKIAYQYDQPFSGVTQSANNLSRQAPKPGYGTVDDISDPYLRTTVQVVHQLLKLFHITVNQTAILEGRFLEPIYDTVDKIADPYLRAIV